jgi:hypothetical protein
MAERGSRRESSPQETEESDRRRTEAVHLLRAILREVTISAEGKGATVTAPQEAALELYALLRQRIELVSPIVTLVVQE